MKKIFLMFSVLVCMLTSCSLDDNDDKPTADGIKILENYALEITDNIPLMTYQEAEDFIHKHPEYVNSLGGCSAFTKQLPNGDRIVGRNMDLTLTNSPVYVYHIKGKYKATGVCYPAQNMPTFHQVITTGLTNEQRNIIPWIMPNDIMNETGFFVEENMRPEEMTKDNKRLHQTGHTNPGKPALFLSQIPAFLATQCSSVKEALELLETVDIYSEINGKDIWNIGFMMADASGEYGIVEVADGKIYYTKSDINVNHFVAPKLADGSRWGIGWGREDYIRNSMQYVEDVNDAQGLMYRIRYSQYYESLVTMTVLEPIDWRGEMVCQLPVTDDGKFDVKKGIKYNCTKEWIFNNAPEHIQMLKDVGYGYILAQHPYSSWQDIRDGKDANFWVTIYSIVANCNKCSLKVRFYEDRNVDFNYVVK